MNTNNSASIGIMAYNEEKNILELLKSIDKQIIDETKINEIILILGGCTDNTYKKAMLYSGRYKNKLYIINRPERKGKYYDINIFLRKAKSKILILLSADTILHKNSINNIIKPFENKQIGIVSSRVIPKNTHKTHTYKIINLIWDLHDFISKKHQNLEN